MPTAGNILIVEDDSATREIVTNILATEGFHVVAAEDGLEALHLLRTVQHRAPDVPCLVLLDLAMPRLSGHEFRRAQLGDPSVAGVPVAVIPRRDAPKRARFDQARWLPHETTGFRYAGAGRAGLWPNALKTRPRPGMALAAPLPRPQRHTRRRRLIPTTKTRDTAEPAPTMTVDKKRPLSY
jgi:CheY-like chemotaxis protein